MSNHDIMILDRRPYQERPVKVSVLITSYNHERFIAQALDSVLMQKTDFNYEIIIGDDASSDATRVILKEYQEQDPSKIRLFLPESNLGLDGTEIFFEILKMAKGEYLALLDGDDYWISPQKLNQQVLFLEKHPECTLCFHNVKIIYEDNARIPWNLYPESLAHILTIEDMLKNTSIQTSSIMVRNQSWILDMEKETYCDWYLSVMAARQGFICYIDEVMGVYRLHTSGAWAKYDRTEQLKIAIQRYDSINKDLKYKYNSLLHEQISLRSLELSMEYDKIGDPENAALYTRRCLKEHSKILEEFVPEIGQLGNRIWKVLEMRLWLYQHPFVYRKVKLISPVLAEVKWGFLRMRLVMWSIIRLALGQSIGVIQAKPNPIPEATRGSFAATTLSWFALNTNAVEVHIGAPDGPLFSRSEGSVIHGTQATGEWIYNGILIYLQDVSDGKLPGPRNTLGFVRVIVK